MSSPIKTLIDAVCNGKWGELCTLLVTVPNIQAKLQGKKTLLFRLAPNDQPGIQNCEWHDTDDVVPINESSTAIGRAFRRNHDFSLPKSNSTVVSSLNLNDTDNTSGELDIQTLETYITVPVGGIWIQYQGGSEGYWAIEIGECCGPLALRDELGWIDREDSLAIVGPVFLKEGQHHLRMWNIDSGGTNSSHVIRYSTDGANFSAVLPEGADFSLVKRAVECRVIGFCDPIPEGWSELMPKLCDPVFQPAESGGLSEEEVQELIDLQDHSPHPAIPQPCSTNNVLIADNEADGQIRTGLAGTSDLFARCDHNHPIRRQANPGFQDYSINGPGTLVRDIEYFFWSDEEAVYHMHRLQIEAAAGNGWIWWNVPTIPGFQRPIVNTLTTYRPRNGNPQQAANQALGNMPDGPYMGSEAAIWTNIPRIYLGPFQHPTTALYYVQFVTKNIRL